MCAKQLVVLFVDHIGAETVMPNSFRRTVNPIKIVATLIFKRSHQKGAKHNQTKTLEFPDQGIKCLDGNLVVLLFSHIQFKSCVCLFTNMKNDEK